MIHPREDKDARGYVTCYHLSRELTETLLTGYSAVSRLKVIRRWHVLEELEARAADPMLALRDPATMRALVVELGIAESSFGCSYIDSTGRKLPMFELTKREQLTSVLSPALPTARTAHRWMRQLRTHDPSLDHPKAPEDRIGRLGSEDTADAGEHHRFVTLAGLGAFSLPQIEEVNAQRELHGEGVSSVLS